MYGDLALFASLLLVRRFVIHRPGVALALYCVTYGLLRFILEFWRRDGMTHTLGVFLSPSQALSAFLVLGGIFWLLLGPGLIRKYKRP
jgi:prolipoprotein diacylglyceryltransferase